MDKFEAQKERLKELVKNHHSAEALAKDMEELKREHPEAEQLGVCHESFCDNEHDSSEVAAKRWGTPH